MKRLYLVALAALLIALPAAAQEDPAALKASYDEKLAKEFVQKAAWERKLTDAQAKALQGGKLIFGYFTRSYAP